ncbi:hypothetical protein CEXT_527321 [Caerostris extrusa]|uniref:Uncharacterized protein n=1 Tax=Caerostris extrusa TaxID=172846 RepID=A0AAV4N5U1_CAEEX|nr:hypothetical protein CEXT_527321 [Caerostris extrusa]
MSDFARTIQPRNGIHLMNREAFGREIGNPLFLFDRSSGHKPDPLVSYMANPLFNPFLTHSLIKEFEKTETEISFFFFSKEGRKKKGIDSVIKMESPSLDNFSRADREMEFLQMYGCF